MTPTPSVALPAKLESAADGCGRCALQVTDERSAADLRSRVSPAI